MAREPSSRVLICPSMNGSIMPRSFAMRRIHLSEQTLMIGH